MPDPSNLRSWIRRLTQFRLATVFLLILAVALGLGWWLDRRKSGGLGRGVEHGGASYVAGRFSVSYYPANSGYLQTEDDVIALEFHSEYVVLYCENGAGSIVQLRLVSNFNWRPRE